MRVDHRLDVLAQSARGEDQRSATFLARADEVLESGGQGRGPRRESADLRLRSHDLGVDGLDDAARIQLAAPETRVLGFPVARAAEVLADLVPDVEERRGAVEIADHRQRDVAHCRWITIIRTAHNLHRGW